MTAVLLRDGSHAYRSQGIKYQQYLSNINELRTSSGGQNACRKLLSRCGKKAISRKSSPIPVVHMPEQTVPVFDGHNDVLLRLFLREGADAVKESWPATARASSIYRVPRGRLRRWHVAIFVPSPQRPRATTDAAPRISPTNHFRSRSTPHARRRPCWQWLRCCLASSANRMARCGSAARSRTSGNASPAGVLAPVRTSGRRSHRCGFSDAR